MASGEIGIHSWSALLVQNGETTTLSVSKQELKQVIVKLTERNILHYIVADQNYQTVLRALNLP